MIYIFVRARVRDSAWGVEQGGGGGGGGGNWSKPMLDPGLVSTLALHTFVCTILNYDN